MKKCSVVGCERPHHAHGMCGMHNARFTQHGDPLADVPHRAHGDFGSTEHNAWRAMLARCRNKNNNRYYTYGARNISVCERWLFYGNFLADMGRKPSADHSIDRINNNGDYCKENCRWATRQEQMINRTITKFVLLSGKRMPLIMAAAILGISYKAAHKRLVRGSLQGA